MAEGILSKAYNDVILDSIPNIAMWLLNDDSVPVSINLFSNDIEPDPFGGSAQFDRPAYTGYNKQLFPLTGQEPSIVNEPGTGNQLIKLGAGKIFQPTDDSGLPITIYGWDVERDPATTAFIAAGRFPEPIVLTTAADFVEVEPAIRLMLQGVNSVDSAN